MRDMKEDTFEEFRDSIQFGLDMKIVELVHEFDAEFGIEERDHLVDPLFYMTLDAFLGEYVDKLTELFVRELENRYVRSKAEGIEQMGEYLSDDAFCDFCDCVNEQIREEA